MMQNNIKLKKDRESKKLIITVGKKLDKCWHISDSLMENSKIKIPMDNFNQKENQSSQEPSQPKLKTEKVIIKANPQSESNGTQQQSEDKAQKNLSKDQTNASAQPVKENVEEIPNIAKQVENNLKQPIIIPTCSQWFKFDEIHEIEMKAFPEFFSGRYPFKTAETYKESRNYIVNLYRENINSNLTSTTCRTYLSGDVCSIMRIHAFLEHWGLINFNIDPNTKSANPLIISKVFNFKTPLYIDANTFLVKEPSNNVENDKELVITDVKKGELRTLYPVHNNTDILFRNLFSKSALKMPTQLSFISKNFRPKCDNCQDLCDIEWYIQKKGEQVILNSENTLLVCANCYETGSFPNSLGRNNFEFSNFFSIVSQLSGQEDKSNVIKKHIPIWRTEDSLKLLEGIEKHGENWESIVKMFNGSKSKKECILHFLQLPLKENFSLKIKSNGVKNVVFKEEVNEQKEDDNLMSQVSFFKDLFEKYTKADFYYSQENEVTDQEDISNDLKNVVYKTYSTSIDLAKENKKTERKKMKEIMNLIVYLQMKKVELKLSYFNEFEKQAQFDKQQLKSMESQLISEKISLAMRKLELSHLTNKLKDTIKTNSTDIYEALHLNYQGKSGISERFNQKHDSDM